MKFLRPGRISDMKPGSGLEILQHQASK